MKKTIIIIVAILVSIGGGLLWKTSKNDKSNYQAEKSSANKKINTSNTEKNININNTPTQETEKEIASFSTKIYTNDPKRQNNISITCKAISSKEVKSGETFSFCDIVGKATTAKGYQEADIYVNGKKEKGLGGGNCQVSTTIYNAVLQVPNIEVIERHQHSNRVPYIQEGKDAAVAYGSYDFKFKNNTGETIKIVLENTDKNITAKICQKVPSF